MQLVRRLTGEKLIEELNNAINLVANCINNNKFSKTYLFTVILRNENDFLAVPILKIQQLLVSQFWYHSQSRYPASTDS